MESVDIEQEVHPVYGLTYFEFLKLLNRTQIINTKEVGFIPLEDVTRILAKFEINVEFSNEMQLSQLNNIVEVIKKNKKPVKKSTDA
jgi:hypothetical protein